MSTTTDTVLGTMPAAPRQIVPPEELYADELAFLAAHDSGPRPPGWRLTPRAVVTFVMGADEPLRLPEGADPGEGVPRRLAVRRKFVGERALVERCVVTLAGERGLLLVGEPGTAKSMLSELLAAAVSGTSALTVQGTAGTTEDQLKYGWNYALLLAQGPSLKALVPSPVLAAMTQGAVARVEEVTRCLPEVQDALISLLSERRIAVPELAGTDAAQAHAAPGFNVIATANLRDKGVSEMSAALKRRFNFETVGPIGDFDAELDLVRRQSKAAVERAGAVYQLDDMVLDVLVTAFRELRSGRSAEGWEVERPSTVMSTAEAVSVATALGVAAAYFPGDRDALALLPGHLTGVVRKDDPADAARLLGYWDGAVRRRAEEGSATWRTLWDLRSVLEG
ncbi:AAA family ATPase [Streptomyces sp. NBC_00056]|uniref:ATP-binding protein n=1 Tax=unclassified Streptomyces TaxID=2593676 RepID=UPI0022577F85|nr:MULTISPECIES: AAA family ATPase [unclassified Streptomyces]MCX5436123.1 AAA family ATPase [Streptomyces sp. NBC_00063]WUB97167.1 AAA family ATPase [Streptomyces sp. NBC_00569]